jgi:hypothetical protein
MQKFDTRAPISAAGRSLRATISRGDITARSR